MKFNYTAILFVLLTTSVYSRSDLVFTSSCDNLSINGCAAQQVTLSATATTDCAASSLLAFNFQIDENNDGTIDQSGSTSEVTGTFPQGEHRIVFTANDECNNTATCEYFFTIEDIEAPIPNCFNSLLTDVIPSIGFLVLSASDLMNGATDNCSGSTDLIFSFSNDISDILDTIFCADIYYNNVVLREIWVTDEAGNQSMCSVYIKIQDQLGICEINEPGLFTMTIQAEEGWEIENTEVCVNGNCTLTNGYFLMNSLQLGDEVTIKKMGNPTNGVTTFDLVLISKHILGTQPLLSPLKERAADANESGIVTTFDIVLLRRLILELDDDFPDGETWIFEPSFFIYDSLVDNSNVVGIKKGDVNDSASPDQFNNENANTRTREQLDFFTNNTFLQKGKTYTLPIFVSDENEFVGGQFTLSFDTDGMEVLEITLNAQSMLTDENFGMTKAKEGLVLGSWNSIVPQQLGTTEPFFEIKILAKKDGNVKEMLEMNSKVLAAEVYTENDLGKNSILNINWKVLELSSETIIVAPNPFTDFSHINFPNKKAGQVEWNIFDISGKCIFSQTKNMESGQNQLTIRKSDLPVKGVYFYEIKTSADIFSGKIVLQ